MPALNVVSVLIGIKIFLELILCGIAKVLIDNKEDIINASPQCRVVSVLTSIAIFIVN
jgi:hypothetical protein